MTSIKPPAEFGQQQSPFPWWILAGLAALLSFGVVSIRQTRNAGRVLAEAKARLAHETITRANLEADIARERRWRTIVSDPASVHVTLVAKSAAALHVFWNDELGVVIFGVDVPIPADGYSFQLKLLPVRNGGQPFVGATFRPDSNGTLMFVLGVPPAGIHSIASIKVSEGPASADSQSESEPVWFGDVPR